MACCKVYTGQSLTLPSWQVHDWYPDLILTYKIFRFHWGKCILEVFKWKWTFSNSGNKRSQNAKNIHSDNPLRLPLGERENEPNEPLLPLWPSIYWLASNFLSPQNVCSCPCPFLLLVSISLSLPPYLCLHLPDLRFVWITPSSMYIIYLSEPPAATTCLACYFPELSDFHPLLLVTYATLHLFNLSFLLDGHCYLLRLLPLPILTTQIFFWSSMC